MSTHCPNQRLTVYRLTGQRTMVVLQWASKIDFTTSTAESKRQRTIERKENTAPIRQLQLALLFIEVQIASRFRCRFFLRSISMCAKAKVRTCVSSGELQTTSITDQQRYSQKLNVCFSFSPFVSVDPSPRANVTMRRTAFIIWNTKAALKYVEMFRSGKNGMKAKDERKEITNTSTTHMHSGNNANDNNRHRRRYCCFYASLSRSLFLYLFYWFDKLLFYELQVYYWNDFHFTSRRLHCFFFLCFLFAVVVRRVFFVNRKHCFVTTKKHIFYLLLEKFYVDWCL